MKKLFGRKGEKKKGKHQELLDSPGTPVLNEDSDGPAFPLPATLTPTTTAPERALPPENKTTTAPGTSSMRVKPPPPKRTVVNSSNKTNRIPKASSSSTPRTTATTSAAAITASPQSILKQQRDPSPAASPSRLMLQEPSMKIPSSPSHQQQEHLTMSPSQDSTATMSPSIANDSSISQVLNASLNLEQQAQDNAITRELIKQYVTEIWNRGQVDLIPHVCSPSLRFNGSVGMDRVGHDGFARMVTTIRDALHDYHAEIHSMVVEGNKAFCRMRFTGRHAGNLLGYPPTNVQVSWMGVAEFTVKNGRILKVWELGDVKSLEEQLMGEHDDDDDDDEEEQDVNEVVHWS